MARAGSGSGAGRRSRIRRRTVALWAGFLCVPLLVVGLWAAIAARSELVPSIGSTVDALVSGFSEGWIVEPMTATFKAALAGFAVGAAVALPFGFLLAVLPRLGRAMDPLMAAGFGVPRIIIYPVLLALFGLGLESKLWMAAVSAFFPVAISTTGGIRAVSPTLVKLGRSVHCSWWQLVTKIYLPAAAPTLMAGCRIGLSISFIAVIIAELFASSKGLGVLLHETYSFQELPRMYAVVLLITLVAFVANLVLWWLERRLNAVIE